VHYLVSIIKLLILGILRLTRYVPQEQNAVFDPSFIAQSLTYADYGTIALTISILVILEGLLSADNALVLAVLVRHLPKEQQKRALRYGIIGAFIFRVIAVIFAGILLDYWIFKIIGAFYLIFLAMKHFLSDAHADMHSTEARPRSFWRTVIGVELADIAFSIDSILAAVAMAEGFDQHIKEATMLGVTYELWTVWTGGILGIITMRYVAGMFIALLDKFPGLASGAYQLVLWIGIKLFASGIDQAFHLATADKSGWRSKIPQSILEMHWEIPEPIFWTVMFAILGISVLRSLSKKTRLDPEFVETMRDLSTMDKQIDSTAGEMVEQVTDLIEPGPIDNSQSK
jgi:YkoY family integral membrane protein